jgi:hypothetical protein
MPAQVYDWTCSAAATEWVERGIGAARSDDVYGNREQVVYAIGYPHNISSAVGLHDGSGAELQRVLGEHAGLATEQAWGLSFDQALALFSKTFGLASGQEYYHWVGIAGVEDTLLRIGNSAPGYRGIYSQLSRWDWDALGPWSVIWNV